MPMQIYFEENGHILSLLWSPEMTLPSAILWIDLLKPTPEEERAAEKLLGMPIPTREEMNEIEVSNRLYEEKGALFMTATMLTKVDSGEPQTHAVTFIVTEKMLFTVRYLDTTSFRRFSTHFQKIAPMNLDGPSIFLMMIESIINRQADILERVERDIDRITRTIFRHREQGERAPATDYQAILEWIGRCGDIATKIHESLTTFSRAVVFAGHHAQFSGAVHEPHATSIVRDIAGLSDHGNHLAGRVNFLLDATLGMISIEQNGFFRVLSVASLIFMPPTLVAGIYGMNFKLMPEIDWQWGYPMALGIMLIAAILPMAYLRQRKLL
jgi:magnesium transporter